MEHVNQSRQLGLLYLPAYVASIPGTVYEHGFNVHTQHAYTLDAEGDRTALDEYVQGITPPPIVWSPSLKVNDDTGTTQQDRPAVALGPDGATYLIWDDFRAGSHADIYFARRDSATGAWSANQKVKDDTTTRTQWNAAIALDGANNAYAVWQDHRDGNRTRDTNIYASKRPAATGTWSANVKVNDDTKAATQRNPRVAAKADGTATAVWVDLRSNQWNIQSARLAAGASAWSANMRVTDNTSSRKDSPDVAVAPDGTAYAVWEDDRGGNFDIYFATLAPGVSIGSRTHSYRSRRRRDVVQLLDRRPPRSESGPRNMAFPSGGPKCIRLAPSERRSISTWDPSTTSR